MFNRVFAAIVLLAIPVVAYAVSYKIESIYQEKWREFVQRQYPDVSAAQIEQMPLKRYCGEVAGSEDLRVCGWYRGIGFMQSAAKFSLVLGTGLLAGIYFVGRVSRGNRDRLYQLFLPGLYVTFASLLLLTILHGALGAGIFFFSGTAVSGAPNPFTTFAAMAVGMGALFAILILIRGLFLTVTRAKTQVVGKRVTPDDCPKLWALVKEMAQNLGALAPDHVIVGLDPNFFVTEAAVRRTAGVFKGRTMFLSLPLCRILSELELRSIIGHELGHFRGLDTKFSQKFYPIYRGVLDSLDALARNWRGGAQGLAFLPAFAVLGCFMEAFQTAENEIGRDRELAADQVAVEAAGKQSIGSALVKLHAFAGYWESTRQRMREKLSAGAEVDNVSRLFSSYLAEEAAPTHFLGVDDGRTSHPTDTHPTLGVRLEALGLSVASVEQSALNVTPEKSAAELIDNYETIEKELTGLEKNFMIRTGEVQIIIGKCCPACGHVNALDANSCPCGFNFARAGVG